MYVIRTLEHFIVFTCYILTQKKNKKKKKSKERNIKIKKKIKEYIKRNKIKKNKKNMLHIDPLTDRGRGGPCRLLHGITCNSVVNSYYVVVTVYIIHIYNSSNIYIYIYIYTCVVYLLRESTEVDVRELRYSRI